MKSTKNKKIFPEVSVIVPTHNSSTTVIQCLKSLTIQNYPIAEIIVVDNASTDNTIKLVKEFSKTTKQNIHIIIRKKNMGVGSSYNAGVAKSKADYVIFLHSDSCPVTRNEMKKLIEPVINLPGVVASYPTALVPREVWETYNFWQKYRFTRLLGKETGFNGKFDCINKKVFLKIGGFDEMRFARDEAIGGEDADLYLRLNKEGSLVHSSAEVIHYHYLGNNYSLADHIKTRKMLARTYGRLLRVQGKSLPISSKGKGLHIPLGALLFLVKPTLAVIPLIPHLTVLGTILLCIYAFMNAKTMYTTPSTLKDVRIVTLPFIDIFLVYYETFWMIQAFIFTKKKL